MYDPQAARVERLTKCFKEINMSMKLKKIVYNNVTLQLRHTLSSLRATIYNMYVSTYVARTNLKIPARTRIYETPNIPFAKISTFLSSS